MAKREVFDGTRTRNLPLRRRMPYPLGHEDTIAHHTPHPQPKTSLCSQNATYVLCLPPHQSSHPLPRFLAHVRKSNAHKCVSNAVFGTILHRSCTPNPPHSHSCDGGDRHIATATRACRACAGLSNRQHMPCWDSFYPERSVSGAEVRLEDSKLNRHELLMDRTILTRQRRGKQ